MLHRLMLVLVVFLLPGLLLAQEGKLRGMVTDKESGEPLIGANVTIEGTNNGASSDIDGQYVVLAVPSGTFTVKVTYVGYNTTTVSNVRILAGQTTTQNLVMTSSSVNVQVVEIVAERPLIQRNTTNTIRVNNQESISQLPFRGVQNIVALEPGVVQQGGNLYVRGGRAGEVGYIIDGASVTNPSSNTEGVSLIREAIESVVLQTGGFTAEYGSANSGIIQTTAVTGGEKYRVTFDYQTDDFAKPGGTFLGTSAYGYRNAVATVSGPIINGIRIFLAGQHNYIRNNSATFLSPFKFTGLVGDQTSQVSRRGQLLPNNGTIEFQENYLYNNWRLDNQLNGNLLFDLKNLANLPMKIRLTSSYNKVGTINGGGWPGALGNYFRDVDFRSRNDANNLFANMRVTHLLNQKTFYEVGVSMIFNWGGTTDPKFGDDYMKNMDSAAVAAVNPAFAAEWQGRYIGPLNWRIIRSFPITDRYQPIDTYSKYKQNSLGLTFDITSQINSHWEVKAGGAYTSWTYRSYNVGSVSGLLLFKDPNSDGTFETEAEIYGADIAKGIPLDDNLRRARILKTGLITAYGYDYLGNETDGFTLPNGQTMEKPYQPIFASGYVQNKFEYENLIVNAGVRYEYIAPKLKYVAPTLNPATNEYDYQNVLVDQDYNVIDPSAMAETDPYSLLLPRVTLSFPVSDRTVFYAQWGKYAQFPSLGQMFYSDNGLATAVNPLTRDIYGGTIPFYVRPERTTQFEIGFRQVLGDNLGMTINGFYKDLKDLIQIRRVFNSQGNPTFNAFKNEDFGTVKGLEFSLELRRTKHLMAKVNYTLSDARGTGATSASNGVSTGDEIKARFPNFTTPLPYDQTHRGAIMMDYRYGKGEGGKILEGMGVNLLATFNSGHAYTRYQQVKTLGQSNPWNVGVYPLQDARFRFPIEAPNSSSTPWVFNIDMQWNKMFYVSTFMDLELYVNVLNVLNTKQVLAVYPTTGSTGDDGWFANPLSNDFKATEQYEAFYKAINLDNRWALINSGYGDVYGSPRRIRVGLKVGF